MAEVNIPPGKGIPLVDLETDLLPEPTMTALDARYAGAGILDDDQTSTTKVWSSEKTSTEIEVAVDDKANLVAGVVPDAELPSRLSALALDAFQTKAGTDAAVSALVDDAETATGAALLSTYVTFKNFDGTPVVGKNVVITLTADGTDIQDITVEAL